MRAVLISQGSARALDVIPRNLVEVTAVFEHVSPGEFSLAGLVNLARIVGRRFLPDSLISRSRQLRIPYRVFFSSRSSSFSRSIADLNPDVIIVYSMSSLLPADILSIPNYGAINIHLSFLPEYPGPNPLFWQYLNFELSPGVTIHRIDAGEDSGRILAQARVDIDVATTPDALERKLLVVAGGTLLPLAISKIRFGEAESMSSEIGESQGLFRARRVKPDERDLILEWGPNFTPERAFHFFHLPKNPETYIPRRPLFSRCFSWAPKSFGLIWPGKPDPLTPGSLVRVGNKFFLRVSGGYVEFERRFSLLTVMASVVRQITEW